MVAGRELEDGAGERMVLEDAPEQPGGGGHHGAERGALQVRVFGDQAVKHGTEAVGRMVDGPRGQFALKKSLAVGHHAVVGVGIADIDAKQGHESGPRSKIRERRSRTEKGGAGWRVRAWDAGRPAFA